MPRTLFLTGSLAPKAMKRRLSEVTGELTVLEYDTRLDQSQHPQVTHWTSVTELLGEPDFKGFKEQIYRALEFYLKERPEIGDLAGDSDLRRAALPGAHRDTAFFRLVNQAIFERVSQRFEFDRLVVTAGGGVHFDFWQQTAQQSGLDVEFLAPEWCRRSLSRLMQRWLLKRRTKTLANTAVKPALEESLSNDTPAVMCASQRVFRLLEQEAGRRAFRLMPLSCAEFGQPDEAVLRHEEERFSQWWINWRDQVLAPACSHGEVVALDFQRLFSDIGALLSSQTYPRWSALKHKARSHLEAARPTMMVTDTQIHEEEHLWCLAAREIGIPVVAYTYDNMLNARIMFHPDHLLVDGMRSGPFALAHGFPAEKITAVRSHRKPSHTCRSTEETEKLFGTKKPRVILADTMTVLTETQASLRIYERIVAAARQMPQVQFGIKFHPLRVGKSVQRSFLGMDENEMQVRQRFLKSLRPPGNVYFIAPEALLTDVLRSAAVLLNTTSVSGHEAFQMGVPVIFLVRHEHDSIAFPEIDSWMQQLVAEDAGTLVQLLTQLISSRKFREAQIRGQCRYLQEYYWQSDLRLTDAISQLLPTAKKNPA
jgi:hypothetical protein